MEKICRWNKYVASKRKIFEVGTFQQVSCLESALHFHKKKDTLASWTASARSSRRRAKAASLRALAPVFSWILVAHSCLSPTTRSSPSFSSRRPSGGSSWMMQRERWARQVWGGLSGCDQRVTRLHYCSLHLDGYQIRYMELIVIDSISKIPNTVYYASPTWGDHSVTGTHPPIRLV